jgi:phosphoribosylformylglycinamidine cyclo-ligase
MIKKKVTYKDSGVDIEKGNSMVNSVKDIISQTHSKAVLSDIGGFGGFFRPALHSYSDPVLVSSMDGVGTKLIVAFKAGVYDSVGQDLVNHCVNDIAVCGADPLFFLDYFSTGKLEESVGTQVVKGFTKACKENGVALLGGETAEMPDLYDEGAFDLAGTIVGIVDREHIIDGRSIKKGDLLLGFKSSGLHTNGYSLARKVLLSKYSVDDTIRVLGTSLDEEMLRVHKSYLPLIQALREQPGIRGFAHITGGGIKDNTRRILPEGRTLQINWDSWQRPPIFDLIQETGNVPEDDMRATFNLGIGLIAVVDPNEENKIQEIAAEKGEEPVKIGVVQ